MAAVSLSPAPQAIEIMSNRRMPLANVPHGANSPYRSVAAAAAAKRLRIDVEAQEDLVYDQEPPSKRQAVEHVPSRLLRTPPRRNPLQHPESHVFNRKPSNSQPTAFERKLHAARDRQAQQKIERQEKAATESLDVIRQWQKHYRRVFPCFVFYFESVPDEVRLKCSKYVRTLGAVSLGLGMEYVFNG